MNKIILFAFALASVTAFAAGRQIAFERNNAVYIADLDGTNDGKNLKRLIENGRFPSVNAP